MTPVQFQKKHKEKNDKILSLRSEMKAIETDFVKHFAHFKVGLVYESTSNKHRNGKPMRLLVTKVGVVFGFSGEPKLTASGWWLAQNGRISHDSYNDYYRAVKDKVTEFKVAEDQFFIPRDGIIFKKEGE